MCVDCRSAYVLAGWFCLRLLFRIHWKRHSRVRSFAWVWIQLFEQSTPFEIVQWLENFCVVKPICKIGISVHSATVTNLKSRSPCTPQFPVQKRFSLLKARLAEVVCFLRVACVNVYLRCGRKFSAFDGVVEDGVENLFRLGFESVFVVAVG